MAALMLENKGYKTFLPLYIRKSLQGRRHQKDIPIPIFPGYLFSCFDESIRLPILTTPGVLYVVGIGRIPSPIEDEEIDAIRRVGCSPWSVEPWPYLKTGDQVYVDRGPLRGLTGKLVAVRSGYRLVLTVELLRRAVAVEIDSDAIVPIRLAASVTQSA